MQSCNTALYYHWQGLLKGRHSEFHNLFVSSFQLTVNWAFQTQHPHALSVFTYLSPPFTVIAELVTVYKTERKGFFLKT